jgi:hypothetical protein
MFEVGVIELVALVPLLADDAFVAGAFFLGFFDDADVLLATVFVAAVVAGDFFAGDLFAGDFFAGDLFAGELLVPGLAAVLLRDAARLVT